MVLPDQPHSSRPYFCQNMYSPWNNSKTQKQMKKSPKELNEKTGYSYASISLTIDSAPKLQMSIRHPFEGRNGTDKLVATGLEKWLSACLGQRYWVWVQWQATSGNRGTALNAIYRGWIRIIKGEKVMERLFPSHLEIAKNRETFNIIDIQFVVWRPCRCALIMPWEKL